MSLTAFVSGASGFVGSHLVRQLQEQGWNVHALARTTSSLDEIDGVPVTVHVGDLVDADSVRAAMPDRPDAVFHVAASTNFWSRNNATQDRVNIDGTRNMVEAAIDSGAERFIHTSSFVTWGFGDRDLDEESPRTEATDWINYVRSKHLAEKIVLKAVRDGLLDAVILNPAHILGPGDRRNWSRMIRMVHEEKVPAAPAGGGNFCDVREIARAHIEAFNRGRCGEKYLLGGDYALFVDVLRIAADVLGKPAPSGPAPAWIIKAWGRIAAAIALVTGREPDVTPEGAAMISYRVNCDSGKAQRELDYRINPIDVLIMDTVAWMKTKGLLE